MPKITIDGEGGLWLRTKRRRRLLPYWCTAVAVAFGMVSAQAADLGRGSIKDSSSGVQYASATWQGPYIGVGIGYRWQSWDSAATCLNKHTALPEEKWDGTEKDCGRYYDYTPPASEDSNSFVATGRVGYDWQREYIVFGVLGEGNWLNANTHDFADAHFSYAVGGRIGVLMNPKLLAYVNGGVEFTNFNQGVDTVTTPFAGGGLELLLADGWNIAAEGRYAFEGNDNLPDGISNDNPVTARLLLLKKF